MAPSESSAPRSTSSWLRREETPSHSASIVSAWPIWSGRTLVRSAASVLVASGRRVGRGPRGARRRRAAAGAARVRPARRGGGCLGAARPVLELVVLAARRRGIGVSVAKTTAASREEFTIFGATPSYDGQLGGLRGQVRHVGASADTDLDELLDAEAAVLGCAEQQVLGLDPAHRAGELPGEQLDQQRAAEAGRVGLPGRPVLERPA